MITFSQIFLDDIHLNLFDIRTIPNKYTKTCIKITKIDKRYYKKRYKVAFKKYKA